MRSELVKAYNWYEKEGGKEFFEIYTNKVAFVDNHIETKGTKEVSGVYIIRFNDIPIGIGESNQMGVRFIEHMNNLKNKGKSYWGIDASVIESGNVELTIDILEDNILEESYRRKREEEMIIKFQPILQMKYDKYYPYDKAQKEHEVWLNRDEIRIDQYIKKYIRKERVSEALRL